eukprot:GHVR01075875.1.p1 GENE.GHVR01075875.1~~GHVR01075875.1.p1  ORF type:complete len:305 (+),score=106.72 GHVR01075875.1:168-1082(+)
MFVQPTNNIYTTVINERNYFPLKFPVVGVVEGWGELIGRPIKCRDLVWCKGVYPLISHNNEYNDDIDVCIDNTIIHTQSNTHTHTQQTQTNVIKSSIVSNIVNIFSGITSSEYPPPVVSSVDNRAVVSNDNHPYIDSKHNNIKRGQGGKLFGVGSRTGVCVRWTQGFILFKKNAFIHNYDHLYTHTHIHTHTHTQHLLQMYPHNTLCASLLCTLKETHTKGHKQTEANTYRHTPAVSHAFVEAQLRRLLLETQVVPSIPSEVEVMLLGLPSRLAVVCVCDGSHQGEEVSLVHLQSHISDRKRDG